MRAAVLTAPRLIQVQDIPSPALPDNGLLLQTEAAAICNTTDYRSYTAEDPNDAWPNIPWPVVLGHEFVGRVLEVGKDAVGWQVGDRISGWGAGHGAYAERMTVVPGELAAIRVPDSLPAEEAAFLELVIGTLRYLARPDGWPIKPGHRVAVTGLGPAGLLYVQFAALLGASGIWAADSNEPRREMATSLGATKVYDTVAAMAHAAEKDGVRFDAVLDSTGADLRQPLARMLRPNAFIVPFGIGFDWNNLGGMLEGIPFQLGAGGVNEARQVIPQVEAWLSSGELKLVPMVSKTIGLNSVGEALEELQRRPKELVKVVVRP